VSEANWSLYLLRNERGALYTGVTTDINRRLREHRGELRGAARFTRACKELELVYTCEIGSRGLALRVESRIKKLSKAAKEELLAMQLECGPLLERLELPSS